MSPERFAECVEFGADWEAEGPYPEGEVRLKVHELCEEVKRIKASHERLRELLAQTTYQAEYCADGVSPNQILGNKQALAECPTS